MRPTIPSAMRSALAWFAFPLVPTLLGLLYHQKLNLSLSRPSGPDPRDWGWLTWVVLIGPLLGYSFLAGATIDLPDSPGLGGPGSWLSRRSLWVAVGPWVGFLAWGSVLLAYFFVEWAYPPIREWQGPTLPEAWRDTWGVWLLAQLAFWGLGVGPLAYGWLIPALAALRRARRVQRFGRSLARGLAVAVGFVVSLIGSFWAITEAWRGYFFDPRITPMLVVGLGLAMMSGCAKTENLGEIRRRELFEALLMAWLLGLALAWRWWSRSGSKAKPPGGRS